MKDTEIQTVTKAILVLIDTRTLAVTHIYDGEEVVSGGTDGQVWVATFASAVEADRFVEDARERSFIYGARMEDSENG